MDGPRLHDAIMAMFRAENLQPKIVTDTPAGMLATLAMVAASSGVSFMPAGIARNVSVRGVSYRHLPAAGVSPTWPLSLIHLPLQAISAGHRLVSSWQALARGD